LAELPGVEFVLVFENRGPEVGATIAHPHGQIYAFDHLPDRPRRRLAAQWRPDADPGLRLVSEAGGWRAWATFASVYPLSLTIAPTTRIPDLGSAGEASRDELAGLLVDLFGRLDRLYDRPLPYMMWLNQTLPGMTATYPDAWFNIEIVSPWRAAGLPRHIAAAEVACEEYFNPVGPEDVATRLRQGPAHIMHR
jgi:UDPglucose--hexose-1-phosphate uridylyltransferase